MPDNGFVEAVGAEAGGSCTLCQVVFTTTNWRHPCRQCGGAVCNACSKHRLRLPEHPQWGHVRVCNRCASAVAGARAMTVEEDLLVSSEIVNQLRSAQAHSDAQCKASKQVLLELEAEAAGDAGLMERYARDPENEAYSFSLLRDLAQQRWSGLLASLEGQGQMRAELQERHRQLVERRDKVTSQLKWRSDRRAALEGEVALVNECEAQRDALADQAADLKRAVEEMRRRMRVLEAERQEQQQSWSDIGSASGSWKPSRGMRHPVADGQVVTISTGRSDPLLMQLSGRPAACLRRTECLRHQCSLM